MGKILNLNQLLIDITHESGGSLHSVSVGLRAASGFM